MQSSKPRLSAEKKSFQSVIIAAANHMADHITDEQIGYRIENRHPAV